MRRSTIRFAILAGLTAALVAMEPVAAQTPSPATPVATAQPSATPSAPPRTSIPGHPLELRFGPTPATSTSFAFPDTSGLPTYAGASAVRREFGDTVPTLVPGFTLESAGSTGGRERFSATATFVGPREQTRLRVDAWTKTGPFVMAVPANSPVTEVRQIYLGGLAVVTRMPTPVVAGGIGPRDIWMTDGNVVWHLEPTGYTDNALVIDLVERIAGIVTSPAPPDSGNSARPSDGDFAAALPFGFGAFLAAAALFVVARRRWSNSSR